MVYFIQAEESGRIKIGKTTIDAERRRCALQTGSPEKLKLLTVLKSNSEKKLHNKFKGERLHGEWFRPSPALMRFIQTAVAEQDSKWRQLIQAEPKLQDLFQQARAIKDDKSKPFFCVHRTLWYDSFKPALEELVGFAREGDPILGTSTAYDSARQRIWNTLPDCRNCCGESE